MKLSKQGKSLLRTIVPLIIGIGLIWIIYRDINFKQIIEVAKENVHYGFILLSLLFGLLGNVIRGLRWNLQIESLGRTSHKRTSILAVLGSYTVSLVFPRLGELWRCLVVNKKEGASFAQVFGTILVDRFADVIMVGSLCVAVFAFNSDFFVQYFSLNPTIFDGIQATFTSLWLYLFIFVALVAIVFLFFFYPHLSFVRKTKEILYKIWEGIVAFRMLPNKFLFILYTLFLWFSYFLFFYITFYAFDFTANLGVNVGLVAFVMGSIGVIVPVQGALGPWHFMIITTLVCYSVKQSDAAAFALIVHTIQTLWTALVGWIAILVLDIRLTNKEIEKNASNADIIN